MGTWRQSDLVAEHGQEEQSIGNYYPPVEEFPQKSLLTQGVICGLLQQNLAGSGQEHRHKGDSIAKGGGGNKVRIHRTYSPPFPQ